MPNIVLIYPKTGFDLKKAIDLPLSSITLASTITDFDVKIIDQRTDKNWKKTLVSELEKEPLCVGISSMTGSQIGFGLDAAKFTKHYIIENETKTKIVWGGIHGTLLPEQTISNENIDILVAGEGEITFRELIIALSGGKDLHKIKGILYKENNKIIKTPQREETNFDKLPELPYDLLDMEDYVNNKLMITKDIKRVLPFISSRGCPYQCTFCCNPRLSKSRWRPLSAEKTYERVKRLAERYDLDGIVFYDENFLANPDRAMKIAELINNQFSWNIQGRMDAILKTDIKKLSEMGLKMVQPGIESGCDRVLKLIKKGEDKKTMDLANQKLAKTEITPVYNFIVGFPTETRDEIMETADFALKLLDDNRNAEIAGFYILVPYPGTEIFELAVKEGFNPPETLDGWSKFDRQHNETPWIKDKIELLNNMMLTSKLIDGKRIEKFVGSKPLNYPLKLLSIHYKNMWRKHKFDSSATKILIRLFKFKTKSA